MTTNQNPPIAPASGQAQARDCIEAGLALSQQGQAVDAIARFIDGIRHAPEWHMAHFLLGSEYAAAGDFAAAEASFAQTVLLAPDFHLARYQLGLLQFSGGRPLVAMLTWAPLRLLAPDQPYPLLVDAFEALLGEQLLKARDMFAAAIPMAGNSGIEADIRKLISRLAQQLDQPQEAVSDGDPSPGKDGGPGTPNHVLLSNYANRTVH
jgi:tetratricopeptide (TPR) repeat protein